MKKRLRSHDPVPFGLIMAMDNGCTKLPLVSNGPAPGRAIFSVGRRIRDVSQLGCNQFDSRHLESFGVLDLGGRVLVAYSLRAFSFA